MSSVSQGPGWWQASDGKWYSPEQSTSYDFEDGEGPVAAHRHPNGGGWVADTATVAESAFVGPTAVVFDAARVLDYATVADTAWVHGVALVSGHARLGGDALVEGNAKVLDDAEVTDNAFLSGYALVEGHAKISGNAQVLGHGIVRDNARVLGDAVIADDHVADGDSTVMGADELPSELSVVDSYLPEDEDGSNAWDDDNQEEDEGYDPDEDEGAGYNAPKSKGLKYALIALVVAVVIGGAIVAVVSRRSSPSTNPTPAGGPSLSQLTSQVKQQVTGTASNDFDVTGVASVVCNPPNSWNPSSTFTCYVYDSSQTEIGEYDGTVEPTTSSGEWRWNADWNANPAYSG